MPIEDTRMQLLQESSVLAEEIDSLGHMNVRYYIARMEQANRALLASTGLAPDLLAATLAQRTDTYTRFRAEQFEGARLHTRAGVLRFEEGGMRSYVEIQNPDTQAVAATFIVTTVLADPHTRTPIPLPPGAQDPAQHTAQIELPAYAQPRSLSLGPMNTSVSLAELAASIPEMEGGGMMSGRRSAVVEPDDVDADGWLKSDIDLMFLPFAKAALQDNAQQGPPVIQTRDGRRVGWAVMETRTVLYGQPRLHDRLAYFSADLSIETKSRVSRRWAFDTGGGQLLGISDTVGVCIDLDARRAVDWPAELRDEISRYLQPQLA